jgi:undecaprenyl pyrophosphate phosphatase UppP
LGIVQGLTELFPVSSSSHLVILQNFTGHYRSSATITAGIFRKLNRTAAACLKFFAYYCWLSGLFTLLVKSSFF